MRFCLIIIFISFTTVYAEPNGPRQVSAEGIRHSFAVFGQLTAKIDENSHKIEKFSGHSRDGYYFGDNQVVIAYSKKVVLKSGQGKEKTIYKLDPVNAEIGSVQPIEDGKFLVSELGKKPRLLEIDSSGKILIEVPIQPETENYHMQTRMARKLKNGNYLVPHLLAFASKEYSPDGKIVRTFKSDLDSLGGRKARNWVFCNIRLENGNTLMSCTQGFKVIEVDSKGNIVWSVTNKDLGEDLIKDACGMQLLPNGNLVIASYGQRNKQGVKLFEVTRDKKVVWKYIDPEFSSVHHFQILTTNGKPVTDVKK